MSLRSLFSTTINSTENLVTGIVHTGNVVGDGITWLQRQSKRINSQETIHAEEREYRLALAEREAQAIERATKIDIVQVKQDIQELDQLLGL